MIKNKLTPIAIILAILFIFTACGSSGWGLEGTWVLDNSATTWDFEPRGRGHIELNIPPFNDPAEHFNWETSGNTLIIHFDNRTQIFDTYTIINDHTLILTRQNHPDMHFSRTNFFDTRGQ